MNRIPSESGTNSNLEDTKETEGGEKEEEEEESSKETDESISEDDASSESSSELLEITIKAVREDRERSCTKTIWVESCLSIGDLKKLVLRAFSRLLTRAGFELIFDDLSVDYPMESKKLYETYLMDPNRRIVEATYRFPRRRLGGMSTRPSAPRGS